MSNRTRTFRSHARALALPAMPDRTVVWLSYAAGALFALYLAFVVITVCFATWQTSLAASVRAEEGTIAVLEADYYKAVATVSTTNPATAGFGAPSEVHYAEGRASGLSFAGN